MSLATLQEMILAAHAGGDGETADWLASIAGDPEQVAQVTGSNVSESEAYHEGDGRWLLEHGYTGTVTDAAGRKQTYADGVHVAGTGGTPPGADARTSPQQSDAATANAQHDAAPAAEKGRFGKLKEKLAAKLQQTRGGRAVLAMGRGGLWLFHQAEHRLLYAAKKTQEIAVQAARERGLSAEATDKLKRTLYVADFVGGYATGGAALAVAGPIAGKVAAVMPSASVAYLAYSTAKNPLATWRAAKKVVADTFAKGGSKHESQTDGLHFGPELAGMLADRIGRSDVDGEWFVAVFAAALAHTHGDAAKALELADAAVEAQPQGPPDDEE
jgi:hypothetical protein